MSGENTTAADQPDPTVEIAYLKATIADLKAAEPQRVQPSREDVARAFHGGDDRAWGVSDKAPFLRAADAVLALVAAQPTLAEAKAAALRDAAAAIDLDAAERAAAGRVAGVRCYACDLRYEERQEYSCGQPGRGHMYADKDLVEAGRIVIEPTWWGNWLRERAERAADGGAR